MSYIKRSLGSSETLLYRAHFPWFYAAAGWTALIALFAGALAAKAYGNPEIAVGLVVAGLVVFASMMVPLWTTEIGVTNQRFIFKRGLIWRATHELQLRAIEEVNLEQGVVGRIFDFGRLQLHGTGVDDIRLPTLADPLGLRKALQDGMAAASQIGLGKVPTGQQGAVSASAA